MTGLDLGVQRKTILSKEMERHEKHAAGYKQLRIADRLHIIPKAPNQRRQQRGDPAACEVDEDGNVGTKPQEKPFKA